MTLNDTFPKADQDQASYQNSASARRVFLVNSSGDSLKVSQIEENRVGSDCSGVDGAANRVLTLGNTSESGSPVSVWVEGTIISQSDLTISHKSSSSTITFSINIYDTDSIRILYYI